MANMNFTADKVRAAIESSKKQAGGPSGDFTPVAFLTPGTHQIRFFFDPEGEVMRTYIAHRFSRERCLCPDAIKEEGIPGECKICKIKKVLDRWQLGARRECLVYGQVIKTTRASEYWDEGKTYCIVGSGRLQHALASMLSLVDENQDYVLTMLNPSIKGTYCKVEVISGSQGGVTITPIPNTSNPVLSLNEPPDWWKPLRGIWVPEGFNQDSYDKTLRATVDGEYDAIIEAPELKTDPDIAKAIYDVIQERKVKKEEKKPDDSSVKPEKKPEPKEEPPSPVSKPEEPKPVEEPKGESQASSQKECYGTYSPDKKECLVCEDSVECMVAVTEGD